ncbi:hypothetical protein EB796_012563 [Bugula neritina]|uniref:Uncharacterized protein n=1 Tax=Bugula neritina TaxID=10212 RepID=A0A7J7JT93_BUGNE|nr:hypothetical protein EB796_012563 [Bugula neritina]
MFSSFQKYLPWIGCKHEWNSPYCYSKDEEEMCTANNTLYLEHMCKGNTTGYFEQYLDTLNSTRISSTDEFFNRKMYNIYFDKNSISPRPMENSGLPKWDLTLTLLFTWLITYLCICKGIKSSGKVGFSLPYYTALIMHHVLPFCVLLPFLLEVVYFTALFPYLAITGLLIVAAQLDGAGDGVKYYLQPPANASVLANHHVRYSLQYYP